MDLLRAFGFQKLHRPQHVIDAPPEIAFAEHQPEAVHHVIHAVRLEETAVRLFWHGFAKSADINGIQHAIGVHALHEFAFVRIHFDGCVRQIQPDFLLHVQRVRQTAVHHAFPHDGADAAFRLHGVARPCLAGNLQRARNTEMRRLGGKFRQLQHIAQKRFPFIRGDWLARRRQRGGLLADDVLYRRRTSLHDVLLRQDGQRILRFQNRIHEDLFAFHSADAAEETDHRVLIVLRIAVLCRPNEQLHLVLCAEQLVERLQIRIRLLQAAAFEEVITLTEQHDRFRSLRVHQIDHLQTRADHARRTLLRIRRQFVFQIRQKACHMATWSAHRQTRFVRPDPFRQRAAARIACHADASRIDFRPRQQDIQCATAVPYAPSAEILAEQL